MIEELSRALPNSEIIVEADRGDSRYLTKYRNVRISPKILKRSLGIMEKAKESFKMLRFFVWAVFYRIFGTNNKIFIRPSEREGIRAYLDADVVICRGGDTITSIYGIGSYVSVIFQISLALLLGKPVIAYAHTIGPFPDGVKGKFLRFLTKIILNKLDLIMVREKNTRKLLNDIGITRPLIYLTADPAFLLEPASEDTIKKLLQDIGINLDTDRPIIGIVPSAIIHRFISSASTEEEKERIYVRLMASLVDRLINDLDATIVLIPHVYGPTPNDDRIPIKKILQLARFKPKIKPIFKELSPEELKGIIGQLDVLISARMHPIIHAISMHVPVIGIEYSHKVSGIFEVLGIEKICVRLSNLDNISALAKITYFNKEKIKKELAGKAMQMKVRAMMNAMLVRQFLRKAQVSKA